MTHHRHHREFDQWPLERKMHGRKPVFENSAARLWDVGNGIACLEFTTETNVLVLESFKSIEHAIRIVSQDFDGLLIGDDDRDFSLGLDMHSILDACERLDWDGINSFIEYGQQVMISLKESPFPVVAVVSGYAMGAGCELLLHCDYVQVAELSCICMDAVSLGIVPCFGGCKEILIRHVKNTETAASNVQACEHVFRLLSESCIAHSVNEAVDMRILQQGAYGISRDKQHLLADAKTRCSLMARHYTPKMVEHVQLVTEAAKTVFHKEIEDQFQQRRIDAYGHKVLECLAYILCGGCTYEGELAGELYLAEMADHNITYAPANTISELELFDLEREGFMSLIRQRTAQKKIRFALMGEDLACSI